MAQVLAKTPRATIVRQDDGSVLTFPPDFEPAGMAVPALAPPLATPSFVPPDSPVPAIAHEALGASPPPAPPTAPDAVSGAGGPTMPAPVAPPVAMPAPTATPPAAAEPALPDAGPVTSPDQIAPPTPVPAPPPVESLQAAEDRAMAAGQIAAQQADDRAALMQEAQRKAQELDAARAQAAADIQRHREAVQAQADKAIQDYVDFDMKPAEKSNGVGNVLALIFGGIGNVLMGQGGAANPVIGILDKKADAAARERAAKAAKLAANADLRGRQVDSIAAFAKDSDSYYAAAKAAELENYARQIEVAASGYDSQKEQLKAQDVVAQLRAQAAASAAAAAEAEHKRQLEDAKFGLDQYKASTDRYQAETGRKQVGLGYANLGENRRQFDLSFVEGQKQHAFDNEMKLRNLDLEIQKAQAEGRQKDVSSLREQREAEAADAARSIGVVPTTETDDKGNPIGIAWKELSQSDGKPFRAADSKRAQELTSKMAATTEAVGLLDRLIRMREKYGWSADTFKSPEWQQMKADYGRLVLVSKDEGGLGALSGPDMGLLHSVLGTPDPTEVRDPKAGLAQARANMVSSFNTTLRANGYTGDAFDIPDVVTDAGRQKAAQNSPEAATQQQLQRGGGAAMLQTGMANDALPGFVRYRATLPEVERFVPLMYNAASGKSDAANAAVTTLLTEAGRGPAYTAMVVEQLAPNWRAADDPEAALDELGKRVMGRYANTETLATFRKNAEGYAGTTGTMGEAIDKARSSAGAAR